MPGWDLRGNYYYNAPLNMSSCSSDASANGVSEKDCTDRSTSMSSSSSFVELANLEMADLRGASQEYYERFSPRNGNYRPPALQC